MWIAEEEGERKDRVRSTGFDVDEEGGRNDCENEGADDQGMAPGVECAAEILGLYQ